MAKVDDKPLALAPTPVEEQEVTTRLSRTTGLAHIVSCWPGKTKRFQKRYGPPQRVSMRNGLVTAAFWDVPLRCITFRSAPPQHPGNIQALKRARRTRKRG